MALILAGINIKIGYDIYYTSPPILTLLTDTHIVEQLLLHLLIIFEYLFQIIRQFQIIGQNRSGLHILMCLLQLFCICQIHICARTRIPQTTLIIFIQSSYIITNHTILNFLLRVNYVYRTQPPPPFNILGMLDHDVRENLDIGNLVKGKITNLRQDIYFLTQILTIRSLHNK